MKTVLAAAVAAAAWLTAAGSPIFPVETKDGKTLFRTPPIRLDKTHLLHQGGRAKRDIAKDLHADIRIGHDHRALIFHVRVNDDCIENTRTGGDLWMQDGVEVMLEAPEGNVFAAGKTLHFMLGAPDEKDRIRSFVRSASALPEAPECRGKRVPGGYELTLKVPFADFAPYDLAGKKDLLVKILVDDWDPADGDPEKHYQPRVMTIPLGELRETNFTAFSLADETEIGKPFRLDAWWSPEYFPVTCDGVVALRQDCPMEYDRMRAVLLSPEGRILGETQVGRGESSIRLVNPGNDARLTLALELWKEGKHIGSLRLPFYDLKSVMAKLGALDWQKLATDSPARAAAWLGVISTVEKLKFSAARYRPDAGEILNELLCRIALLEGGRLPENIPPKLRLLTLGAGAEAQVAVEMDYRERPFGGEPVYVSIPWGNIPLVQAEILFFPTAEIADNYLRWRMRFTTPLPVEPFPGADRVAAGRGHMLFDGKWSDRDLKRTVTLVSPRFPDCFVHLECAEAAKIAPTEVIVCADAQLSVPPPAVSPGNPEKLTAFNGTPAGLQASRVLFTRYGVETGILMVRKGNAVYETAWNRPALDRRFMQLLLDPRPLTAAEARKLRDLRAAGMGTASGELPFRLFSGDHHTHSLYSDGSASPAGLLADSVYAGMDYIILTDHNRMDSRYVLEEIARKSGCGLKFSGGIEATYHNLFHLNIYPMSRNINLNCAYRDLVRQARDAGSLIQLNHPLSGGTALRELWYGNIADSRLDAAERHIGRRAIWRSQGITPPLTTGGTDTHSGCFSHLDMTVIGCGEFSDAALVDAFRKRRVAMVAPRLGEYIVGDPEFAAAVSGTLLAPDNPARFGRRLAEKLRSFDAVRYIEASSPTTDMPGCFTIIDKKYNRPYSVTGW